MPNANPVIIGVGMITAVGVSARETATSVRSGASRFIQSHFYDKRFHPFTLAEVPEKALPLLPDDAVPPLGASARERRMLRLGLSALSECLKHAPVGTRRPPLVLALPETQTTKPVDGKEFVSALSRCTGPIFDVERSHAVDTGRAGSLLALGRASELIRSGQAELAVAGGIDTYRDAYILGTLDREQRVKSEANLDGFIPGEAAAFVLLTSAANSDRFGIKPIARITQVAQSEEPGHLYSDQPYRGDGLAETLAQLFGLRPPPAPIADVYSSMNGESHWAKEWGVGVLRNKTAFSEPYRICHPADCFGDIGAACGAALVALAALGIAGGQRSSPCLVYASSDRAPRVALMVEALEVNRGGA